jgi:predicted component of type VI protein secretion system
MLEHNLEIEDMTDEEVFAQIEEIKKLIEKARFLLEELKTPVNSNEKINEK